MVGDLFTPRKIYRTTAFIHEFPGDLWMAQPSISSRWQVARATGTHQTPHTHTHTAKTLLCINELIDFSMFYFRVSQTQPTSLLCQCTVSLALVLKMKLENATMPNVNTRATFYGSVPGRAIIQVQPSLANAHARFEQQRQNVKYDYVAFSFH